MGDNNDENKTTPVPGPGPSAPLKEDSSPKQRDLTLEEIKELDLDVSHEIPPEGAVQGEKDLTPEMEMFRSIQSAADFISGGIQSFDGYVTDGAEEVADEDIPFLSGFEQGYLGRGGSFSISKALECILKFIVAICTPHFACYLPQIHSM